MTDAGQSGKFMITLILAERDPDMRLDSIVEEFCRAVGAGETPHPRIIAALSEALESGKLAPRKRSGRPRGTRTGEMVENRDYRLAGAVQQLRDEGLNRTKAIEKVRIDNNESVATVEKAYIRFGDQIQRSAKIFQLAFKPLK